MMGSACLYSTRSGIQGAFGIRKLDLALLRPPPPSHLGIWPLPTLVPPVPTS
ncbi:hypothetical protein ACP70R_014855 [Stipagrostis hirtigluma subsp. patula]